MKAFASLLLIFCLSLASCVRQGKIELDPQDAGNIAPDQLWAVVAVPYVAFHVEPDLSSEIVSHARSADVFAIMGQRRVPILPQEDEANRRRKSTSTEYSTWYKFDQGWLDSLYLEVYDTKPKATQAARRIASPQED